MVSATFLGTYPRTYPQYLDTDPAPAGTTLVAEPLNTYQIAIADQWDIGPIPGDGLWGEAPRGIIGFGITPGLAVIGGMTPGYPAMQDTPIPADLFTFTAVPGSAIIGALTAGFPGFVTQAQMESMLAPAAVQEAPAAPVARVVRGRRRKLRPAPARRPRRDHTGAGVRA